MNIFNQYIASLAISLALFNSSLQAQSEFALNNHSVDHLLVTQEAKIPVHTTDASLGVAGQQPLRNQIGVMNCLSQPTLAATKTLELIQAIEKAVCFSPETNSAWVQTKIQAAQLAISKSSYYPQLSTNANYDWGKDNYQVKDRSELSYDTNTRRFAITLQANWLLYDFGTRKAQVDEANKLLATSLALQNQVLQEVILKTITAYYEVIQYELKQENLKQLVAIAQKNYDIAHARYRAGAGIKSDALQMQANLAKAQSSLTQLNGELNIAKGNLAILMGEPAYQDFKTNNKVNIPTLLNLRSIQDLLNESLQVNPKLKAAQLAVEAAQAKVRATKRSQYPAISLLSNMSHSKQLGESPFANDTQRIQAGIQVSFPVFDGFNQKYQIRSAQENLKLKQLEEDQLKLQTHADIWKSYNQLQAMHDNLIALKSLNESASQAFEVTQGRYKAGVGNLVEVINAQNMYIEARLNFSTALTEFLIIRFQLLANIGNLNLWDE
ncbi:TolC family protein [Acinetobacter larvae]|uniref:Protein CyaE n=1 Tax=Acinetobacter larvae TaxID=1789224 RepID=A0A1B2M0W0_9GAMM|nr:TolC family protein [Acinetobacter larvae]AOA58815.1 hypothetical protein BFG52_10950 [Acinetobacter larvae]